MLVPGGRGVFPSLTVEENLALAGWALRRAPGGSAALADARRQVAALFPRLSERRAVTAGMLSGGEQQMLALAQGLLCRPSVLLVDELSLGLAPTVVGELLRVVRQLAASGVAVVLVEQSVTVAAAIADEAVFLERGRVRFRGDPAALADRHDLVRAVFLGGSGGPSLPAGGAPAGGAGPASPDGPPGTDAAPARNGHRTGRPAEPAASGPALQVVGLCRRYGGVTAVDDVTVTVAPGEIVGLIGANGAGKTTVLDMVSGFLRPDRGRVLLGGRDVTTMAPASRARLGLGRVFQDARLFPSLPVAQALATALERQVEVPDPFLSLWWTADVRFSEEALARQVDELVAAAGLQGCRHRMVSQLSTGMRRVVELACAAAHRPDVLLLDEPSAGLAQRESEALADRLLGLRDATGVAMVVVEHDVPLLAAVADRLVCLHLGRVIAEGPPQDVLASPAVLDAYLGTEAVAARRSAPLAGAATVAVPGPGGAG